MSQYIDPSITVGDLLKLYPAGYTVTPEGLVMPRVSQEWVNAIAQAHREEDRAGFLEAKAAGLLAEDYFGDSEWQEMKRRMDAGEEYTAIRADLWHRIEATV